MKRRLAFLSVAALLVSLAVVPSTQPPVRVVLISIDGLMPTSYTQPHSVDMPHLRRLTSQGTYAEGVVGVLPTNTFPTHTTLISGVAPAVHGIIDNAIVDPDGRSRGAWFWYASDIRVPTLFTEVARSGRRVAAVNWPVTVGLEVDLLIPDMVRSGHPESLTLLRALSSPELFDAAARERGDSVTWPLNDRDWTAMATFAIESRAADFVALHLLALDGAQHSFGVGSAEANRALAAIDTHVGRVVDSIERSGNADRTFVVVVSDHGFSNTERSLQPNALFLEEGLLDVNDAGRVVDWQAYCHSSGGSGFIYLADPNDAAVRSRVGALLTRLAANPDYGVASLWTTDDLAELQAHPEAAFGIGMRPGWYTGGGTGSLLGAASSAAGHGFPPAYPELHASFIVSGPGVRAGQNLGIIGMTQVGPTLATWLGVQLVAGADAPVMFGTDAAP